MDDGDEEAPNGSASNAAGVNQSDESCPDPETGSSLTPEIPKPSDDVSGWYTAPENFLNRIDRLALKAKIPRLLRRPIWAARHELTLYWLRDRYRARLDESHEQYYSMPSGETIHWPIFWLTEAFTPSTLDALLDGIDKAGWSAPRSSIRRSDEVREWIAQMRRRGDTGMAWMNLVTIIPKDGPVGLMSGAVRSSLPEGIKRVVIRLHQPTSALTLLRAGFVLDESESLILDRTLKEKTEPRVSREPGMRRRNTLDTVFAKRGDLKNIVTSHHVEAQKWIARRVPGIFWNVQPGRPSVIDLMLTEVSEPAQGPRRGFDRFYLEELGIGTAYDSWICTDPKGLYLHAGGGLRELAPGYTLSGRYADVFADDAFQYMGDGKRSVDNIVWRLDMSYIDGIASRLAITDLLRLLEHDQAATRDLAKRIHGRGAVRSSLRLRERVFGVSLDIVEIARGLEQLTADRRRYAYDVLEFEQRERDKTGLVHVTNLVNALRKEQREASRRLAEQDRQLREVLHTGASLSAAAADIRLQRWTVVIAMLSILIAVGAVVVSVIIADPSWWP
ncbi:hypothetical protein OG394_34965 [Kribbella sp. NBC_01245]|uniref:hypothetical protein n=1 Tax=Kribbella sp. NBC_01245 TaxID=2903578 RepID=UPI002E2B9A7C|nr:hypothetical protein [Kribbella sp. NBC_01245]